MEWLKPSGGLGYHYRALRYRNSRWIGFRRQVSTWLANWRPTPELLILVGPSAGHTIDFGFLGLFSRVIVFEPDPIARMIFGARFSKARFPATVLQWEQRRFGLDEAKLIFSRYPRCALLFCNVLGQLAFEGMGDSERAEFGARLRQILADFPEVTWASYHDRLSGPIQFDKAATSAMNSRLETRELAQAVCGRRRVRFDHSLVGSGSDPFPVTEVNEREEAEVIDHDTYALFTTELAQYGIWELAPGIEHLIEWVQKPT